MTHFAVLSLICFATITLGGAQEPGCKWEERAGIALDRLKAPAVVLREYSDVTSSRDCYQKCCEIQKEGCNVAVFLSYEAEVVCMNVKCEPFNNCLWRTYTAAIAAVNEFNTFASLDVGPANATTVAPGFTLSTSQTPAVNNTDNESQVAAEATSSPGSLQYEVTASPAANTDGDYHSTSALPNGNTQDTFGENNADKLGNDNGRVDENTLAAGGSYSNGGEGANYPSGTGSNRTSGAVYNGVPDEEGTSSDGQQINYTVSITIGVVTCVAFLVVMYVVAKKFHLFKDRSKYSRLLENPEQLKDPLMNDVDA